MTSPVDRVGKSCSLLTIVAGSSSHPTGSIYALDKVNNELGSMGVAGARCYIVAVPAAIKNQVHLHPTESPIENVYCSVSKCTYTTQFTVSVFCVMPVKEIVINGILPVHVHVCTSVWFHRIHVCGSVTLQHVGLNSTVKKQGTKLFVVVVLQCSHPPRLRLNS